MHGGQATVASADGGADSVNDDDVVRIKRGVRHGGSLRLGALRSQFVLVLCLGLGGQMRGEGGTSLGQAGAASAASAVVEIPGAVVAEEGELGGLHVFHLPQGV